MQTRRKGSPMAHLHPISRTRMPSRGATDILETVILTFMAAIFYEWDNFASVYQNLQKFYAKTP